MTEARVYRSNALEIRVTCPIQNCGREIVSLTYDGGDRWVISHNTALDEGGQHTFRIDSWEAHKVLGEWEKKYDPNVKVDV